MTAIIPRLAHQRVQNQTTARCSTSSNGHTTALKQKNPACAIRADRVLIVVMAGFSCGEAEAIIDYIYGRNALLDFLHELYNLITSIYDRFAFKRVVSSRSHFHSIE